MDWPSHLVCHHLAYCHLGGTVDQRQDQCRQPFFCLELRIWIQKVHFWVVGMFMLLRICLHCIETLPRDSYVWCSSSHYPSTQSKLSSMRHFISFTCYLYPSPLLSLHYTFPPLGSGVGSPWPYGWQNIFGGWSDSYESMRLLDAVIATETNVMLLWLTKRFLAENLSTQVCLRNITTTNLHIFEANQMPVRGVSITSFSPWKRMR